MATAGSPVETFKAARNAGPAVMLLMVGIGLMIGAIPAPAQEVLTITPEEAVTRVLSIHPELRAAAHRRLAAGEDARGAEAGRLPVASASANYTHTGRLQTMSFGGRSFPVGAEDAVSVSGRIDQVLFTGGRLSAQIEQAKRTEDVELARLEALRQGLVLRVREACLEVQRADALLAAAVDATASAQAHRRDAEARVRSGVAAGVEVTRADVRVAEARLNETATRNRRDLALSRLATLLGLPTTTPLSLAAGLPEATAIIEGEDLLDESRALELRPDLQALRLGASIAALGVRSAQAGYWPSLSAFGTWTWQDDETRDNGDESWNVGLAGSWTLFDWGRTTRGVEAARHREAAADADISVYSDRVRLEVREARLAAATAASSIRLAEARLAAATEDRRISLLRFREGVGTGTEVIDADQAVASASAAVINARVDLAVASVRRWYATGGDAPR